MCVGVKILVTVRGQYRVDLPGPIAGRLFNPSMDGATVNNFQNDQLHQIEVWVRWPALVVKGELWVRWLALVLKGSMPGLLQRALQGLVSPKCAQCSTPVWISLTI